ncbi:MAG: hypothetical protein COA49_06140 [Bacteroidetes bacterium]|nr:MAG: hypothetical protein COA49_06140 [Bacteroidota bacterium]
MKPEHDTFTSYIQGLYEGHEATPPSGVKDSVFNQLDALSASKSLGVKSVSYTSKAVLGASIVIVGFAWYLAPLSDDVVTNDLTNEVTIEEVVRATPEIIIDEIEAPVVIIPVEEVAKVSTTDVIPESNTDELVEGLVEDPGFEVLDKNLEVIEEAEAVEVIVVKGDNDQTSPVILEKEYTVQDGAQDEVKEEVKEEEKKGPVEWILPASLEVDE